MGHFKRQHSNSPDHVRSAFCKALKDLVKGNNPNNALKIINTTGIDDSTSYPQTITF